LQGNQGAQGDEGAQGAQGVQGLQGNQGNQGAQGVQGLQGAQGAQGVQGLQGAQGVQGTQGLQGAQGVQGLQGNQGAQGNIGPGFTYQKVAWVDPLGNDGTAVIGKPEKPFQTINKAIDTIINDNLKEAVIFVHPGDYTEVSTDITINGITIFLLGGVQINADPSNTSALYNVVDNYSFAVIATNQDFNTKSNYPSSNVSLGGAIIESAVDYPVFQTDGTGDEQTSIDLENLKIVQNGDEATIYLLETCNLSVRNSTITNTRDDRPVIYCKGNDGFHIIIEECQLLQDIAAIQFDTGSAGANSYMSIHNTQFSSKTQINGRGWIESISNASFGLYQQWGNNIFWIVDVGNKFYAWADSNSAHPADVDVIAACFTNSLTLSNANNTTAGGGSILAGQMPMQDPVLFRR
jgi:hypothetical protein